MSAELTITSDESTAGDLIRGFISIKGIKSKIQSIELRLSCSFCGGTLVNPSLDVKRMNVSALSEKELSRIPFSYPIPVDAPSTSSRSVGGVDQGVKYTLTARIIKTSLFNRIMHISAPVKVVRKDSGAGIKVKFVKLGGTPFREMLAATPKQGIDCH
jgi:hypothetical protein